jgi:hypothetical protein
MPSLNLLEAGLARFDLDYVAMLSEHCRPKILVVADDKLNFTPGDAFGLWRFLDSLLSGSGLADKPIITLAHRGNHSTPIIIGDDTFHVKQSFKFVETGCPVTICNYDQIWLFGADTGNLDLTPQEIEVISVFMNSGGGVFAAGDHASLGRALCGSLPRIRHMRNWETTAMGTEDKIEDAVKRIDTVVNPGTNNLFEFYDQSDNIPQHIYPNYKVEGPVNGHRWQATIHPLLMLPGAPQSRTSENGSIDFILDIDVLPDHPHESICFAVTDPEVLKKKFPDKEQIFDEFPPSRKAPEQRIAPEIVAFAVSGGRSINNEVWKPPVTPQMFGAISAYDGHQAQPYIAGGQPPGCIVCDSTWHHFINLNLDGTGSICRDSAGISGPCSGLGSWSGPKPGKGTFTPSPELEKIFVYYRNIVRWLQPTNQALCSLGWTLFAVRYHPLIVEELLDAPRLIKELLEAPKMLKTETWRGFVGLGFEAAKLINLTMGSQYLSEMVARVLLSNGSQEALTLLDLLKGTEARQTFIEQDILLLGIIGGILAKMTVILPDDDPKPAIKMLEENREKQLEELMIEATQVLGLAFKDYRARVTRTDALYEKIATSLNFQY